MRVKWTTSIRSEQSDTNSITNVPVWTHKFCSSGHRSPICDFQTDSGRTKTSAIYSYNPNILILAGWTFSRIRTILFFTRYNPASLDRWHKPNKLNVWNPDCQTQMMARLKWWPDSNDGQAQMMARLKWWPVTKFLPFSGLNLCKPIQVWIHTQC